ncbi:hypothetical protein [Streptomyces longispororuber]|nr:hypothetical protein [Streptomyces longispororuber]
MSGRSVYAPDGVTEFAYKGLGGDMPGWFYVVMVVLAVVGIAVSVRAKRNGGG